MDTGIWQSIEYYMSNYPDVLEAQRNNDDAQIAKAMKVAFEDQLVQKVMPKLRGIETRGKSKSDCLDKIRTQLVNDDYTIIDDFDLACEFGYGQFIWNSANYLKDDDNPMGSFSDNGIVSTKLSKEEFELIKVNEELPQSLIDYAEEKGKELWELKISEMVNELGFSAKEAKDFKDRCNASKGK